MAEQSVKRPVCVNTLVQLTAFLNALFECDGLIEFRYIHPNGGRTLQEYVRVCEAGDLLATSLERNAAGHGVYCGANPRLREGGKATDVQFARSLCVDFDEPDTPAEALLQRINDADLSAPTVLVFTGGGHHAYWRLQEPLTDRGEYTHRQKALINALGSDKAVHDMPRVMRLPGFVNTKPKRDGVVARLISCEPDRVWPVDEFPETARAATKLRPPAAVTLAGASETNGHGELSRTTLSTIAFGASTPVGERDNRLYAAAVDMKGCRHTYREILDTLSPPFIAAGLTQPQIERTVRSAVSEPRQPSIPQGPGAGEASSCSVVDTDAMSRFTDLANAKQLVAVSDGRLRYCHPWRKWLVWDGTRWQADETGEVLRFAVEAVKASYREASQSSEKDYREKLVNHARRSESAHCLEAMTRLTRPLAPITPDQLDANPWLLNVENGVIDLWTGELRPQQRSDLITKLAPVVFDTNAQCPRWERFLTEIMAGNEEKVRFLQRLAGYSAVGVCTEHVLIILWGTGRNGKSTFIETIRGALGDYATGLPVDALLSKRGDRVPSDVARLKGARFAFSSESPEGRRLDEATVKVLTGGDTLTARFLHADFFDFTPSHTLWLSTNHRPVVRETAPAIWSRLSLGPFTESFEDNADTNLPEALRAESPGILRWIVAGAVAWQREGLHPLQAVQDAVREYRSDSDTLAAFLEEATEAQTYAETPTASMYASYRKWADDAGERPVSQKRLGSMLLERGYEQGRRTRGRYWRDVKLTGVHEP